ncbi:hypothetical protein TWF788_006905 [Orbilia oligospora]|uniref:Uncharacterized protein n=1 Tax=Orbilia oligospora TaxID=2813651 RepID=A0A7C8TT40_ORBOL|nr:hypothetical protein TWF788_006905 [Orbilia oligospora]
MMSRALTSHFSASLRRLPHLTTPPTSRASSSGLPSAPRLLPSSSSVSGPVPGPVSGPVSGSVPVPGSGSGSSSGSSSSSDPGSSFEEWIVWAFPGMVRGGLLLGGIQAYRSLDEKIGRVDEKIGRVEERIGRVEERIGRVEADLRNSIDGLKGSLMALEVEVKILLGVLEADKKRRWW